MKSCSRCGVVKPLEDFSKRVANTSGYGVWCKQCHSESAQERVQRKRQEVFALLGVSCARCGFSDTRALQIDHVLGGGAIHMRRVADPYVRYCQMIDSIESGAEEYQILCANCNWIKRAENGEHGIQR